MDLLRTIKNKYSLAAAVKAANITLIVLLSIMGLVVARDAVTLKLKAPAPAVKNDAPRKASPSGKQSRTNLMAYSKILENNVFGFEAGRLTRISGKRKAKENTKAAPAPMNIDITLIGAIAWNNGFGYAIVQNKSKDQQVYKVGETIPETGVLKEVLPGAIIINSQGKDIMVSLTDITPSPEAGKPDRAARRGKMNNAENNKAAKRQKKGEDRTPSDFARQTDEGEFVVDKNAIEESLANPQQIMTDARLLPNFKDGAQHGFNVSEVKKGGIYESIGLKNGDVLLSVNGLELSDPGTALSAFTALRGMDKIELQIDRDGETSTITYNIR